MSILIHPWRWRSTFIQFNRTVLNKQVMFSCDKRKKLESMKEIQVNHATGLYEYSAYCNGRKLLSFMFNNSTETVTSRHVLILYTVSTIIFKVIM